MANWANVGNVGDPRSPDWQKKNLTWIEPVPGQRWQVYKPAAAAYEGLLRDLIARGYKPTSSGGFNYRNIRGSNRLSQHAFGTAIDLNSMTNKLGSRVSDIPDAAALARKWGLEWGGNWKGRADPMHFEYRGNTPPGLPEPAGGGGPTNVPADAGGEQQRLAEALAAPGGAEKPDPWDSLRNLNVAGLVGGGAQATPAPSGIIEPQQPLQQQPVQQGQFGTGGLASLGAAQGGDPRQELALALQRLNAPLQRA